MFVKKFNENEICEFREKLKYILYNIRNLMFEYSVKV